MGAAIDTEPEQASRPESNRARALALLILIVGLGVLVRTYRLDAPLLDRRPFRQIDTAAVARNFHDEGMNPLYPRVDWRGTSSGLVEVEGPVYTWSVAVLYHVFGVHDAVGRGFNILFFVLAAMLLFRLTRHLFGGTAALFAVFFYSFCPLSLFYTRSFQGDSMLSFASLATVFYFWRWCEDKRTRHLVASGLALWVATMIKPPSLYLGLPLLYLCLRSFGVRFLAEWRLWAYAVLSLLPTALWYWHGLGLWEEHGNTFGIFGKPTISGLWALDDPRWQEFATNVVERLRREVAVAPTFLFLLIGVFQRTLIRNAVLFWWTVGFVVYMYMVPNGHWGHDYYQLPLVFALAAWMGVGATRVHEAGLLGKSVMAVSIAVFLGYSVLETKKWHYIKPSHMRRIDFAEEVKRVSEAEADSLFVFISPPPEDRSNMALYRHRTPEGYELYCDPIPFYLSDRVGWSLDNIQATPGFIEHLRQQGARFVATSDSALMSDELFGALEQNAKSLHTSEAWRIYRLDAAVAAEAEPPGQ